MAHFALFDSFFLKYIYIYIYIYIYFFFFFFNSTDVYLRILDFFYRFASFVSMLNNILLCYLACFSLIKLLRLSFAVNFLFDRRF